MNINCINIIKKQNNNPIILLFLFFIIYVLFPTSNSTVDAYDYAACVIYGEDLFLPHHLLYNFFGFIFYRIINLFYYNIDALALLKIINSIFATLCLYMFYKTLKIQKYSENIIFSAILFAGSCFGFMRFAVENETYIIPIFFSLFGSFYFIYFIENNQRKYLFYSGLYAAVACLFHQIHFFWWFGLLIGVSVLLFQTKAAKPLQAAKRLRFETAKPIIIYTLPALLVPIIYIIILVFYEKKSFSIDNLIHFVFRDFYNGSVDTSFTINNIKLGVINLFRTFYQVHGIVFILIRKYLFLIGIIVISFIFLCLIFLQIKAAKPLGAAKLLLFERKLNSNKKQILVTHTIILILQVLFAFYSVGNAEFMVMIPFLLLICGLIIFNCKAQIINYLALSMLVWNLGLAIIPSNIIDFFNYKKYSELALKNRNNYFIFENDVQIKQEIYYSSKYLIVNVLKSPSNYQKKNIPISILENKIDSCLQNNISLFTDCINKSLVINRSAMLESDFDSKFFAKYNLIPCDTVISFAGNKNIYRILNK